MLDELYQYIDSSALRKTRVRERRVQVNIGMPMSLVAEVDSLLEKFSFPNVSEFFNALTRRFLHELKAKEEQGESINENHG